MTRAFLHSFLLGLVFSCACLGQTAIVVYYNNPKLELQEQDRGKATALPFNVYPVRRLLSSKNLLRASLLELLKGPTPSEIDSGYFTAVHNLKLKRLTVSRGKATVQLSGTPALAGTLSGPRLRLQIERTLKQFRSIRTVCILVNERSDFDRLK